MLPQRVSTAAGMGIWSFIKSSGGLNLMSIRASADSLLCGVYVQDAAKKSLLFQVKLMTRVCQGQRSGAFDGHVILMSLDPRLITVSSEMLSITVEGWIPSYRCLEKRTFVWQVTRQREVTKSLSTALNEVYFSEVFVWSSGPEPPAKIHAEVKFSLELPVIRPSARRNRF